MKRLLKLNPVYLVALSGWIGKAITAVSQIFLMRLMLDYLGVNDYSVYVVLLSIYGWLALADFGVGMSYQAHVSKLRVEKNKSFGIADEKFATLILFVVLFNLVLWPVSTMVVTAVVFGWHGSTDFDFWVVFLFCGLGHFASIFSSIYKFFYAVHKGYLSNLCPAIASICTVLGLIYVSSFEIDKYHLFIAVFITYSPLLMIAMLAFFIKAKIRFCFDFVWMHDIFKAGAGYMLFGFLSLITINVDLLIISYKLSPYEVVEYNLVLRLFALVIFLYSAYLMAMMPVGAEMIRRNEFFKLNKIIKRGLLFGLFVTCVACVLFISFRDVIGWVLTGGEIAVSVLLIIFFFFYTLVRIWVDTFAALLQSVNCIGGLVRCVALQALVSAPIQLLLIGKVGVLGSVLGMLLSFIVTVAWFLPLQYKMLSRGYLQPS